MSQDNGGAKDDPFEQLRRHAAWVNEYLLGPEDYTIRDGISDDFPQFTGDWRGIPLEGRDLRCADFRFIEPGCLRGISFEGADLRGARLEKLDLTGAIFGKVRFAGARLDGTKFRDAYLVGAQLDGSSGLSCESLGGADLSGASLPAEIDRFEALDGVAEASKYLQGIFRILLIACGFVALTLLSFRDDDLLSRDEHSMTKLPILGASISPRWFSFVAPLLILILYAYQFLYTLAIWRLLSYLPAFFPDGSPLDRRAHPLITNIFIRFHLKKLTPTRDFEDYFQYSLRALIAFAGPPATLALAWVACLKMHHAWLSAVQAAFYVLASFWFVAIMNFAPRILRDDWVVRQPVSRRRTGWFAPSFLTFLIVLPAFILRFPYFPDLIYVILCGLYLIYLNRALRESVRRRDYASTTIQWACAALLLFLSLVTAGRASFGSPNLALKTIELDGEDFPRVEGSSAMGWLLSWTRIRPFFELRNVVLSRRPLTWTGRAETEGDEVSSVSGANLEGADLRSMDAERAFFVKANLRDASLQGSYLRFANLREADLTGANLKGAYLRGASFRDTSLHGATLTGAIFSEDRRDPTYLMGPNFQGAKIDYETTLFDPKVMVNSRVNNFALAFFGVKEKDKALWDTDCRLKRLVEAGIPARTDEEFGLRRMVGKKFDNLPLAGADFRDFNLTGSTFNGDRTDLTGALFQEADLSDVGFRHANLAGADFRRANLAGADFCQASLHGARFEGSTWRDACGIDPKIQDLLKAQEKSGVGSNSDHPEAHPGDPPLKVTIR